MTNLGYPAQAFTPGAPARSLAGRLFITGEGVRFESPEMSGALPAHGLALRRGGHNNTQLFFEHPEFPGWSICTSDPGVAKDPLLAAHPHLARQAQRARGSRSPLAILGVLLGLLLALFLAGIIALWMQRDRIIDYIASKIPVSWEETFGDKVFESVARQGVILTNSPWEPAVGRITSRLLPVVADSGYAFKFHIQQDTNVNAFAIPGGHVVILTGLLEKAESAEEVAGVLAHELAHVTRRHSLRNIIKSAGLLIILQAALGDASGLAGLAVEGSRYLLQQKFSRDFEREADDAGWNYLIAAKMDPRGMTRFFEKLKELTAQAGMDGMENSLAVLNTHPTSQERIDRLAAKWAALQPKPVFADLGPWKKE